MSVQSLPWAGAVDVEVIVADADALLGDACTALLNGKESRLLDAIDAGAARAVMSEQAFRELGWISAKAARGHGVSDAELRAMLEREYLPRIPVVVVPSSDSDHWMPAADDVTDPDDVAHAQLARLISARAIYSHDRDLRRPGLAPKTRAAYDARVGHLSVVTAQKQAERGLALLVSLTGSGAAALVSRAAERLRVSPSAAGLVLALAVVSSAGFLFAEPERRRRVGGALESLLIRTATAMEHAERAQTALAAGLVSVPGPSRLETEIGGFLVRHPDSTRTTIATALDLSAQDRTRLPDLLRGHPVFEQVSRSGWAVGTTRRLLETVPPPWPPSAR